MPTKFDSLLSLITENPDIAANVDTGEIVQWDQDPNVTIIFYKDGSVLYSNGSAAVSHGSMNQRLKHGVEDDDDPRSRLGSQYTLHTDNPNFNELVEKWSEHPHKEALCARYFHTSNIFSWWSNSDAGHTLGRYTESVKNFLTNTMRVDPKDVYFDNSYMSTEPDNSTDEDWEPEELKDWEEIAGNGATMSDEEKKRKELDTMAQIAKHLGVGMNSDPESPFRKVGKDKMAKKDPLFYNQNSRMSESFDKTFNDIINRP